MIFVSIPAFSYFWKVYPSYELLFESLPKVSNQPSILIFYMGKVNQLRHLI